MPHTMTADGAGVAYQVRGEGAAPLVLLAGQSNNHRWWDAARRALLELMYTPGWSAANPGPYPTLGDPGMPAYAQRRHLAASNRHDAWQVLPDISAPTLVAHGTDDHLNPAANAPLLADRIPDTRLHMIPGARHPPTSRSTAPSPVRSSWIF
ncbi:alpha/beta fold hydrolase [Streptomyces globisporus]|uniref:alpha/beta fold hydrolase n=1 Tax=Streptomyces globisporus TaxID=1908 RepID=UPI00370080BA